MDILAAHRALADPTRLAIAQALLGRDLSPGEIGDRWGLSTSLTAHHIGDLVRAGIADKIRSEHDARKSYLTLRRSDHDVVTMVGVGLTPAHLTPARVAFVCTRNSARSKMAAAWWRRTSSVPVIDAGTHPAERPHPLAEQTATSRGLHIDPDMHEASSTVRDDDLVIAVCDHAHERLASSGPTDHLHWSVPDPIAADTPAAFERACDDLQSRVHHLQHLLLPSQGSQ
ncbi:MarR family transcriptional regulator [Propionibacteriaceae bacterium G57]|uniref:arsenate reductase/protein-tyrosine-phosphatase family protein n=1 Tax=Aestuariimicrobium sp. G57 TaxID=3418485 RepID=UPI003DA74C96